MLFDITILQFFCQKINGNLRYFIVYYKKAGNARRNLLAYLSFFYHKTRQNGENDLSNFLGNKTIHLGVFSL